MDFTVETAESVETERIAMNKCIYILNKLGQSERECPDKIYRELYRPKGLSKLGIKLFPVTVDNGRGYVADLFGIKIGKEERNDELAQSFSDATMSLFALFETFIDFDIPIAFRVPSFIVKEGGKVKLEDIIKEDSRRDINEMYGEFALYGVFGRHNIVGSDTIADIWKNVPTLLENPNIFNAVCFYSASIREFQFVGDSIEEVFQNINKTPVSKIALTWAENAIQNAFKAIEAIIGDPPKNDTRLREKLRELALDPDENLFLYPEYGGSIIDEIKHLNEIRDKRAAHGRTNINRRITYFEMMNAQYLARYIIFAALHVGTQ